MSDASKLKVAIKYCGGCNPDYDRTALVNRIKTLLSGQVEFASLNDESIDLVLTVQGCKTAGADLSNLTPFRIYGVTSVEDGERFIRLRHSARGTARSA